jgi:hypothetical protein
LNNISEENHNCLRQIHLYRNDFKLDSCFYLYCVVKYSNEKILYKIIKLSKKKAYYYIDTGKYPSIEPFLSSIDIKNINFISTDKDLALSYMTN